MKKLVYVFFVVLMSTACSNKHYVPLRTYEPCHNVGQCALSIANAISDNWSRPDGATRNLSVKIELEIEQTGKLKSVKIISGSGWDKFDTYAIKAVKKAAPFTEIKGLDQETFNRNFAVFRLQFQPLDL
jgi:colicin import membrane protein